MSFSAKRNTDLDLDCGCYCCETCRGTGLEFDETTSGPCEACKGLCKTKMCPAHALAVGWITEKKIATKKKS